MKKYILIAILLSALLALNGCTLLTTHKVIENDIQTEEKEVFAQDDITAPVGGSHIFTVETDEGEVLAPDGEVLATYSYSYPVFKSNDGDNEECIEAINQMLEENAVDTFVSKDEFEILLDEYLYAKDNGWNWFGPFDHSYKFEINMDAKGIISITEIWYDYTGGAHGNAAKISHTFDVIEGKELSLSDLLYGSDEEITKAFTQEFLKIKDEFFDDPSKIVPEEFPKAQYYVDAKGVTAYFQQYQVGPYVSGFVSATISDKEMLKFDFSDIEEK